MKLYHLLLCCLPLLLSTNRRQQPDFIKLQPLAGTWKSEGGKRVIYESWSVVKSGEMHGRSYHLRGADTVVLEDVKLLMENDGIFYIANVKNENGNKPVPFKLVEPAGKQFTFENAAHDFPQRVIYSLVNQDSLHAWIEGKQNGRDARIDYYYKRIR